MMVASKIVRTASWIAAIAPTQSSPGLHPQTLAASTLESGPSTMPMSRSSMNVRSISSSNFSALEQFSAVVGANGSNSCAPVESVPTPIGLPDLQDRRAPGRKGTNSSCQTPAQLFGKLLADMLGPSVFPRSASVFGVQVFLQRSRSAQSKITWALMF